MTLKLISLGLCVLLMAGNSALTVAQSTGTDRWAAVRALAVDENLVVKQKDGKTIKGRMIDATDQTLILDRDGKPYSIARLDIQEVLRSVGKAKKAKWALIGAGVGAGVGTAIGAAKYSPNVDDSEMFAGIGLFLGLGIGSATGALFGSTRRQRELIYQAP
jgi:hypothetical protein